jgi:hypothetical protein
MAPRAAPAAPPAAAEPAAGQAIVPPPGVGDGRAGPVAPDEEGLAAAGAAYQPLVDAVTRCQRAGMIIDMDPERIALHLWARHARHGQPGTERRPPAARRQASQRTVGEALGRANGTRANGGPPVQPAATRMEPAPPAPTGAAAAGGGSHNALHSLLVLAEPAAMLGADAAGLGLLGQALLAATFRSLRRTLAS